jgi:hypothetical protein
MAGRQISGGCAILLTLASNMGVAGTAGYMEGLLASVKLLQTNLRDLLPNIMVNGCRDSATISTNLEVNKWVCQYFRNCDSLRHSSITLAEKQIKKRGEGCLQTVSQSRLRLPSSPGSLEVTTFVVGETANVPNTVRPPTLSEETDALNKVVNELW